MCESVTTLPFALFTYGYNYVTKSNTQGNAQLTSLVLKYWFETYNSLELTTKIVVGNFDRKLTPAGH